MNRKKYTPELFLDKGNMFAGEINYIMMQQKKKELPHKLLFVCTFWRIFSISWGKNRSRRRDNGDLVVSGQMKGWAGGGCLLTQERER